MPFVTGTLFYSTVSIYAQISMEEMIFIQPKIYVYVFVFVCVHMSNSAMESLWTYHLKYMFIF